jgi:hypothetical protein
MRNYGKNTGISVVAFQTLAALLLCLLPAVLDAEGTPKIEAPAPAYDFGEVYRGIKVEHVFRVRNAGSDTLRITNVRSSCGCTVALMDKKILAPGGTAQVKASFDSERFAGFVEKSIYVESDDPEKPITKLTLTGKVKVDLSVSPSRIYFSGLKAGERMERTLQLNNLSEQTITISEISSTVPQLKFEVAKLKLKPGESTELKLYIDKVTRDMKLTGNLTIFNSSQQKSVDVLLYGGTIE